MLSRESSEENYEIKADEVQRAFAILASSLNTKLIYHDEAEMEEHRDFIGSVRHVFQTMLKAGHVHTREEKLNLIQLISKLKMQQERLDIASGIIRAEDLKIAGERLGRKSQSAFEAK